MGSGMKDTRNHVEPIQRLGQAHGATIFRNLGRNDSQRRLTVTGISTRRGLEWSIIGDGTPPP